jgi:hypothetical protein
MSAGSTHERLKARLELMKSANTQGFDAPSFTCIETLVERSKNLPHNARIQLEELARFRLSEYQTHFNEARADVEMLLEDLDLTEADKEIVDGHFQRCDFKGLTRYILGRMKDRRTIFQRKRRQTDLFATFGSAEELAQLDLLAELESGADDGDEALDETKVRPLRHRSPLKLLREHAAAEKNRLAVGTARKKKPEIAGPLNSQTLATQLLEELETLSPIYLKRVVSHLEIIRLLNQVPKPKPRRRPSS